jgi:hypothetical protein
MKFKVGDIIVYSGHFCSGEIGREQVIKRIVNNKYYHTNFLDDGKWNSFDSPSNYEKQSILVDNICSINNIYENGVPVEWGNEL